MKTDKRKMIDTAMKRKLPDMVLKNGNIVDVFSGEIYKADVAICGEFICGVGEYSCDNEMDVSGKYIMPGFIDTHLHIESSMVTPSEYVKICAAHGVTTLIADPHEITNVCGENGLNFMREVSSPIDIKWMLPSCVPATPFEHSGCKISADDTIRLSKDFFGIGEMMNYPGIVNCDEETLKKLCKNHVDGHAPSISGNGLDAYIDAGIKTDHECTDVLELNEKVRKGMYVLIREGTLSKDIEKLIGGVNPYTMRRCTFCTDDRFIGEIDKFGSIDYCIKKSVSLGVNPIDAVIMATLNAAECFGLSDRGAIAPAHLADIIIADNICPNKIETVIKSGEIIVKDGKAVFNTVPPNSDTVSNTVHLKKIDTEFFSHHKPNEFTAIELIPHTIVTKKTTAKNTDKLSKVCVIERHHNTGSKGFGYVTNYGITNGAIASSIGHDSHNITVIGDNDRDMALAVNTLNTSGGIAVCAGGKALAFLELEIAGLMSSKSAEEVIKLHDKLYNAAKELKITDGIDPFLSLAFIPLPVIPEIRITDMGLFDVEKFDFI